MEKQKQLDYNILVLTHNSWGKGKTIIEAKENAGMPREYDIYFAPPGCSFDPLNGGLYSPANGFKPIKIESKRRNKRKGE